MVEARDGADAYFRVPTTWLAPFNGGGKLRADHAVIPSTGFGLVSIMNLSRA